MTSEEKSGSRGKGIAAGPDSLQSAKDAFTYTLMDGHDISIEKRNQMPVQWYVLRSKPNKEMILWRELTARGFECFYPHLVVRPVNPRSRKVKPYFPGYLFLQTDMEQAGTSTFQWMPFSSGFIAFDDVPATVPDNLVQAIRRHVDQINLASGNHLEGIQPGEPVTIEGGPFDGYEAIFDVHLSGSERARVLLNLLQARQLSVELPAAQIKLRRRSPRNG